ncbi:MAG: dTDP-4-dehydrorhamnose 3,5-epimerase [Gaiellaceae bacterium]
MIFTETAVAGAFVIDLETRGDERGFFARAFCRSEFEQHGLNPEVVQCNLSLSANAGTLRGLHFQVPPHEEAKLIRCTQGALFDVALDLRPESASYLRWVGVELTAENRRLLYLPEGCAHGFQTLLPNTEVFYQVSAAYAPEAERGFLWDDPAFGIAWPDAAERTISEKDGQWPDYEPVNAPA